LQVDTVLRGLVEQADAVVQSADATVVIGRDGQARVRVDYRVFNRSRQFLRLKLPDASLLFGATTAGRPVKPLAGKGGSILLPIQKVPLGGNGYPVSILYRTRAGEDLDKSGKLEVLLPDIVDDVQVDRTVVRLYVPDGYDYDFDSSMTPSDVDDVAAQLADVAIREARSLLQLSEKGTLDQRFHATQNGLLLIADARARLANVAETTGMHRALAGELNQLSAQLGKNNQKVQEDVAAAQRGRANAAPSVMEFASNARNLVQLEDVTNGLEDAEALGNDGAVAEKNKAAWVVNPTHATGAADGPAKSKGKDQYRDLQDRLTAGLRTRAGSERRKNFQSRAGVNAPQPQSKGSPTRAAPMQAGQALDAKQVKWLNETLKQEQVRNRQLGAVDTRLLNTVTVDGFGQSEGLDQEVEFFDANANGQVMELGRVALQRANDQMGTAAAGAGGGSGDARWKELTGYAGRVRLDDAFAGNATNPSGVPFGVNAEPSSVGTSRDTGVFFHDGDGDYRSRVQNLFARPGAEAALASGKVGKMGVDVALPTTGKVYYFRSLSGGAPIKIDADKEGRSLPARVITLLFVLGCSFFVGREARRVVRRTRGRTEAA
jgi:hypothetical protein